MTADSGSQPLIRTSDLRLRCGTTQALAGVDLELGPGQLVGLLGPNDCGKTTLLKILAGVLSGYTGEATVAGHAPGAESKALVSFLPDASALPIGATATSCIQMFSDFFADFDEAKAQELIEFFGLDASMQLRQMSKGMREKVQMALALSRRARVSLLDEPISARSTLRASIRSSGGCSDDDDTSHPRMEAHSNSASRHRGDGALRARDPGAAGRGLLAVRLFQDGILHADSPRARRDDLRCEAAVLPRGDSGRAVHHTGARGDRVGWAGGHGW